MSRHFTKTSGRSVRFYRLFLSVFFFGWVLVSRGQEINNYTFSQTTEPYQVLSLDSSMGTASTDDQNFNAIRLGFQFKYNGVDYNQVSVNHNGFVVMGPVSGYGFSDACISVANASGRCLNSTNTGSTNNLVSAFNMDLQATGYSSFGIKRMGTAPNRVFVVQWHDVRRYASSTGSDTVNTQIRLYETTNVVEFRYGRCVLLVDQASPLLVQVGLRGASAAEFACRSSASNWAATSQGTSNLDGVRFAPTIEPTSGLVFRYSPIPPAQNDLAMVSVLSPVAPSEGCVLGTGEKVKIVIRNNGTLGQTILPVGYRINSGTVVNQTFTRATPLLTGALDTLTFTQGANLSVVGDYRIVAFTKLSTEQALSRGNDTLQNYTLKLKPPRNLPQPIVTSLSVAQQNAWKQGTGKNNPSGTGGSWTTAFPFATESIAMQFATSPGNTKDWLYSPNLNITDYSVLIFRSAFTADLFGSSAISNIGDDTVKVMVSFDCGSSWKVLKAFKQNDLTQDTISNALREFRFKLTTQANAQAIVAFYATNNNTPASNAFRFHVDDVEIREIPPFDASVVAILKPKSASPGCVLTAQEPPTVVIRNNGSSSFNSVQVGYTVNGGAPVNENFTLVPALQPGSTDTVTFLPANGANLSQPGSYVFNAFTNLTGELSTTHANDTTKNYKINLSAPFPIPSTLISTLSIANANSWKKGRGYPITDTLSNWFSSFAMSGTETISVLSTTTNSNLREWLISPTYSITPDAILVAKIAVTRGNITALPNANMGDDTIKLMVTQDCGGTWKILHKFSQADIAAGILKDSLKRFVFPLNLSGSTAAFGFFFQNLNTGAPATYRVHLKDIQVRSPLLNNDLAAISILAPVNNVAFCPLSNQETVRVVINNQGLTSQTSSLIAYSVNGQAEKSATFTFTPGPLGPGGIDTVEFTGTNGANLSTPGVYVFKAYTKLNEDPGGIVNDTVKNFKAEVRAPLAGSSFVEFFDASSSLPIGWTPGKKTNTAQEFKVKPDRGYGSSNALSVLLGISNPTGTVNSPRYHLPPANTSLLRFKYRLADNSGDPTYLRGNDSIVVRYTKDCGASYQTLIRIDSLNYIPNNLFQDTVKLLTGLEGQDVMFIITPRITKTDTSRANFDLDNWIIEQTVATQVAISANGFQVFPNPATDVLKIKMKNALSGLLTLTDVMGKTIWRREISESNEDLDVSHFSKGIYFLTFRNDTFMETKKIEIVR